MRQTVVVITPPAVAPVSVDEAKALLPDAVDGDDDLIESLIAAATARLDGPAGWLGRALVTQTLELQRCDFGLGLIDLPYPPYQADSIEVTYTDGNGDEQTLDASAYRIVAGGVGRARLFPAYGTAWPATRWDDGSVKISYRAGYGDTGDDVLEPIRLAIKLHVQSMFRLAKSGASGFLRSETVEGVGSASWVTPDVLNGTIDRAMDALLAQYRVFG